MMFIAGIFNITFGVVRGTATVYYLKNYLNWNEGRVGTFFLISGLAMIFGAMITKFAVKAIEKKWSYIVRMAFVAATAVPFYWIQPDQTELIFVFQILGMIFSGINATLYWAQIADTADYGE